MLFKHPQIEEINKSSVGKFVRTVLRSNYL